MATREKIKKDLAKMSLEDLNWILGRYCGPYNRILSEKKFGYHMPKHIVEEIIMERSLEKFLLEQE